MVEVVDFDNESHTFEVDARSEAEASEPPAKACRSWTFADDSTADDIEGILKELSEYIEHEV